MMKEFVTLTLGDKSYRAKRGFDVGAGPIGVHGEQIDFCGSNLCPNGRGTYKWSIKSGQLRFDMVSPDPCHGQSSSMDARTRRARAHLNGAPLEGQIQPEKLDAVSDAVKLALLG